MYRSDGVAVRREIKPPQAMMITDSTPACVQARVARFELIRESMAVMERLLAGECEALSEERRDKHHGDKLPGN